MSASHRRLALARRLRSGMTAVNSGLSFAATPSLPSGGVGDSGFGRLGGDDGLREFARSKAITTRRAPSLLPAWTFARDPNATARRVVTIMRLLYGRPSRPSRPARPCSTAVDHAASAPALESRPNSHRSSWPHPTSSSRPPQSRQRGLDVGSQLSL